MTSDTTTASMAAAGIDKRANNASSLQTPGSGGFPSEMRSPLAGSPSFLKKDELKTPITPPSAYLDFLNKMSPAIMSPAPTSASSRFNSGEKTYDNREKPANSPPLSAQGPALSRNTSYESNVSMTSQSSFQSNASQSNSVGSSKRRPESPRVVIPPSPFAKPGAPRSARTSRLRIPQSPFSPAIGSAQSVPSPYCTSSTPLSAAPWSASFSSQPGDADGATQPGKVSVRQVVTRTVTYCRTPLDPAPKGKRRKIEVEDLGSKSASDSENPSVKQETTDEETRVDNDTTPQSTQPKSPAKET